VRRNISKNRLYVKNDAGIRAGIFGQTPNTLGLRVGESVTKDVPSIKNGDSRSTQLINGHLYAGIFRKLSFRRQLR